MYALLQATTTTTTVDEEECAVMSMSALKALVGAKRQKRNEEAGGRQFVRRGVLDAEREEREEQEEERRRKEANGGRGGGKDAEQGEGRGGGARSESTDAHAGKTGSGSGDHEAVEDAADVDEEADMSVAECKRVLRRLRQPATLFGETDDDRRRRLRRVKKEVQVIDDVKGGQQENMAREIMQETEKVEQRKKKATTVGGGGSSAAKAAATEADLQEQFAAAAGRIARQIEAERRGPAASICAYLQNLAEEWEEELGEREESEKRSMAGRQATAQYVETAKNLKVLYDRAEKGTLEDDVTKGLWMIVEAMKARNYLNATDIYVRLAIGNAPWPIGVTSVGIHERSAREKISHAMNKQSAAHVMNDEGTRKWLQAVKRLLTFCQQRYPTDPSRCVNFNLGKSDLQSLHRAIDRGETTERLALPAAPHHHDHDGSIRPPLTWKAVLNNADREMTRQRTPKG